jgi:hypothetical protein
MFQCGGGNVVRTRCLPAALLIELLSHLVLLHIEGRREWHSRVGQADRYRRRLGTNKYSVINLIHNRKCRFFLGVGKYTPSAAVRGEMGWKIPVH